eukprot:418494_1
MHRKLSTKWKKSFSVSADESHTNSNSLETAFTSDDIIKQGYLSKESAHLKKVRKRWMILKRDYLYSYKQTDKPTEIFDLSIYDSVKILDIDYGKYRFELVSTKKQYRRTFIASSNQERNEWVQTIKEIQTNRIYKNWKYIKSNKALQMGFKKTKVKTAFLNKTPETHNPTDDPLYSDDSDYEEQSELIASYKCEIILDTKNTIAQDIMDQLFQFGYSKAESIEAINSITNKNDINGITEYIESKRRKLENDSINISSPIYTTEDFTDQEQWEFVLNKMSSGIPSEQQLLIFLKMKILAENILSNKGNDKYRTLNMKDIKLQQTVLNFNGGLVFLYQLGFEHDDVSVHTLICNELNANVVKACIKCLENKMKLLSKNVDFKNYRRGTVSDNIIAMSSGSPSLNKSKTVYVSETKRQKQLENFNLNQSMPLKNDSRFKIAQEQYFMQWQQFQSGQMKEKDWKLYQRKYGKQWGSFGDNNEEKKEEIMDELSGATQQFYNFLCDNNLEKYFEKFKAKDVCDIRDIEYLMDDDEKFLQNDIGIMNAVHRKKLIGQCRKLKREMDNFEHCDLIPSIILKQLWKHGIVTMDILCKEVENKIDLKMKYGINDDKYCDLVWNIVELQSDEKHKVCVNKQLEQEGMINVQSNETNYID